MLFVLYIASILPNTEKVEIPCPQNKAALLYNDEIFMTLMKLRLDFPFTDISQHFLIYIWWSFTQVFYSSAWSKRLLKSLVS